MSGDLQRVLTPLRQAMERIERKAQPLPICREALPEMLAAIRSLEELNRRPAEP